MGLDAEEEPLSELRDEEEANGPESSGTLCLHAFSDLTHVSPLVFLYLLKECYIHGSNKATKKFQALQYQVHQVLANKPQPGPASFIVQCLNVLPVFGTYGEGFSHLLISSLRRYFKTSTSETSQEDMCLARRLAATLFLAIVGGIVAYDEKVMVNTLKMFDVGLTNIDEALLSSGSSEVGFASGGGSVFLERYISDLIKSKSFMTAVSLLEHFSLSFPGDAFLQQMVEDRDFVAAEKWAIFMGRPSLCVLVQEYGSRNMLKQAYNVIKKNYLQHEFPDLCYKCKESALKDLAEKACWDVAERQAKGDTQLLEYLVYLAMEAGYIEKVDELCDRYSLKGLPKAQEAEVGFVDKSFLHLKDLAVEEVVWVDEVNGLREATSFLEECKVIGLDCEWKPNYMKGSEPNKVSIMQIGSDTKVFILDLIKLYNDASEVLDSCLSQILQSYKPLKLGYNFQCDIKQLALSYGDLECFKSYEMLLDIQNVFKEATGGLSGLTKKILGVGLNKTRRNSDWEQRPLAQNQLEYAALDAAVLVHIFRHVRDQPPSDSSLETTQWKSHIVSHMDNQKKSKKPKNHSMETSASVI
ncbi:unnamed protein product [Microthlaspi erraticum]|uniref:3'-5' exonuclease domain-containing protein n=1 Tax=Microthlaspi erraticum TaxID=1685480 RepID=A0A6D2K1C9_9BRAS|nr:unnamed protein product [Microthlaspi erraticum]